MSPRLSFVGRFLSDVSTRNNVAENYRPSGPLEDLWNVAGGAALELLDCRVCAESGLGATDPARRYTVTGAIDRPSAKMVDLDPEWQMSSQIWGMELRVADPATGELAVKGQCAVSAFRDLWRRQFGRIDNGQPSGARFVTVMLDLEWGPAAALSPILTKLQAETQDGKLSVGLHQFGYFYTQDHPRYRTGSVILHIGPHRTGEPETALVHRRIGGLALNVRFAQLSHSEQFRCGTCHRNHRRGRRGNAGLAARSRRRVRTLLPLRGNLAAAAHREGPHRARGLFLLRPGSALRSERRVGHYPEPEARGSRPRQPCGAARIAVRLRLHQLLHVLDRTFNGAPEAFDAAIGLMFELKLAGQMLVALPAMRNGVPTGLNAGPTFQMVDVPV